MIHVFNIPAITWTLTAVLLLSGSHHLQQAGRSPRRTEQINNSLHAVMHLLMAAMLWHLARSTALAQITVLAGAALWFVIQAVALPEFKFLCAEGPGRLKCIYHGLTMAGAAAMIAMTGPISTGVGRAPTDAMATMAGMSMSHGYHAMTDPAKTRTTSIGHSPNLAILLTAVFTAAAIIFITLLLRTRTTQTTHHNTAAPKLSKHAGHALEALGAAVMAFMFATMMA